MSPDTSNRGVHFPGADRADAITANAVHIPGSAHFFADIPAQSSD